MAQLITREELALVLDETISAERFAALYKIGLRVVRSGWIGDPEDAPTNAAEVIAGVLFGVVARIVSNPRAARQLNAGGAGLTFGGSDAEIRAVFTLTDDERATLAEAQRGVSGVGSGAFSIRPGT